MTEKKDGKKFEKFVAVIERAFAGESGVDIKSPYRLVDKDTGKRREHDVLITRTSHHGQMLTSVECKDKGRPVGVDFVEQFSKKCEKTGVHHGVIVSATGFYETAKTKAKALNIACMTLEEATGHDWIGDTFLVSETRNFLHIDIYLECYPDTSGKGPVAPPQPFLTNGDVPLTAEIARDVLVKELPDEAYAPRLDGIRHGEMMVPGNGVYVIDANGDRFDVKEIKLSYQLEIVQENHAFEQHTYKGDGGEFQIASGDLNLVGISAKLMMIRSESGIQVSVAPGSKQGSD